MNDRELVDSMIKLAAPNFDPDDIQRVVSCLKSGNLVQGQYVDLFEDALVEFTNINHCAVVSSGTAALHLALLSLDIKPGDGVLVPAFTFPATSNVVERVGARTVLCDVDPNTYVVTPDILRWTLASQPQGSISIIIVVHEFGFPLDMQEISQIGREFDVRVIEDAACAMGTVSDGFHPGHYSDIACLSFHPRKAITTGEGGAVLTTTRQQIDRLRLLRNHGMCIDESGVRDFVEAGLNYRMTDFQAALGVGQVERFSKELQQRTLLAEYYLQLLQGVDGIRLPVFIDGHSWQTFMIVLDDSIDRGSLMAWLRKLGIESGPGAQALHCLTYYREKYEISKDELPHAADLYYNGLALPLHGGVSIHSIEYVCQSLREGLQEQGF